MEILIMAISYLWLAVVPIIIIALIVYLIDKVGTKNTKAKTSKLELK